MPFPSKAQLLSPPVPERAPATWSFRFRVLSREAGEQSWSTLWLFGSGFGNWPFHAVAVGPCAGHLDFLEPSSFSLK